MRCFTLETQSDIRPQGALAINHPEHRDVTVESEVWPGTAAEEGTCKFHGHDPERAETASSDIRFSDVYFCHMVEWKAKKER